MSYKCSLDVPKSYFKNNFICLWPCWVFVAVHGFSLVAVCRLLLRWLSQSTVFGREGFSSCGFLASELGINSYGTRAELLQWACGLSMTRGLESMSPALVGDSLTTESPGGPSKSYFFSNKAHITIGVLCEWEFLNYCVCPTCTGACCSPD